MPGEWVSVLCTFREGSHRRDYWLPLRLSCNFQRRCRCVICAGTSDATVASSILEPRNLKPRLVVLKYEFYIDFSTLSVLLPLQKYNFQLNLQCCDTRFSFEGCWRGRIEGTHREIRVGTNKLGGDPSRIMEASINDAKLWCWILL